MMLIIAGCLFVLSLFSTLLILAACKASSRADAALARMQLIAQEDAQPRLQPASNRTVAQAPATQVSATQLAVPLVAALEHK